MARSVSNCQTVFSYRKFCGYVIKYSLMQENIGLDKMCWTRYRVYSIFLVT